MTGWTSVLAIRNDSQSLMHDAAPGAQRAIHWRDPLASLYRYSGTASAVVLLCVVETSHGGTENSTGWTFTLTIRQLGPRSGEAAPTSSYSITFAEVASQITSGMRAFTVSYISTVTSVAPLRG